MQEIVANPEAYIEKKKKSNQSNAALSALQSFAGGAPTQQTSIFGQQSTSNTNPTFGLANAVPSGGIFGQQNAPGAPQSIFGQQQQSIFGQNQPSSAFGQNQPQSGFGQPQAPPANQWGATTQSTFQQQPGIAQQAQSQIPIDPTSEQAFRAPMFEFGKIPEMEPPIHLRRL